MPAVGDGPVPQGPSSAQPGPQPVALRGRPTPVPARSRAGTAPAAPSPGARSPAPWSRRTATPPAAPHAAPARQLSPRALGAEHEHTVPRQRRGLQPGRARDVVHRDHGQAVLPGEGDEPAGLGVVVQPQVAVGDHRAATVPPASPDDVHPGDAEGVRRADHGADVVVVPEVLDRDVERVRAPHQLGGDGLAAPVAVAVDDVAAVPLLQQLRVPPVALRPRPGPRADPDLAGDRPLAGPGLAHPSCRSASPSSARYGAPSASTASRAPVSRSTTVHTPTTSAPAWSTDRTAVRPSRRSSTCPRRPAPGVRRCPGPRSGAACRASWSPCAPRTRRPVGVRLGRRRVQHRRRDRVGAERQPADRPVGPVRGELAQQPSDQRGRLVLQRDAAQVDVVVGLRAGGERDPLVDDGDLPDQRGEAGASVCAELMCGPCRTSP
ncbi:hypothetical protein L7F22_022850 [Adiantum nelumboides]|nr:hypothetical protein [Adiantum nelumboides]